MSDENTGCLEPIDHCEYISGPRYKIPSQYADKPRIQAIFCAIAEKLTCQTNNLMELCGYFNCEEREGDALTLIGENAGWPRTHCNVKAQPYFGMECVAPPPSGTGCDAAEVVGLCDGAYFYCRLAEREDYTFTDDELYRSFIKAKKIKNRAIKYKETPDVALYTEIIQALWGPNAWVVFADNGQIGVSAGRDLTADEQCILTLYGKVICGGLGISIVVYCVEPADPCDAICPELPDLTKTGGTFVNYTSPVFQNATGFNFIGFPAWLIPVDNGDGTFSAAGLSPSGASSVTVTIEALSEGAQGCSTTWTIECLDAPVLPVCPDDVSIDCDDLPYTITGFSNVTSFTVPAPYTATANAGNTELTIDSVTPTNGTVTITASNDDGSCQTNVTITGCATGTPPTLSGIDCPAFATIDQNVSQNSAIYCPFNGTGTITVTGAFPSGWLVQIGNCYQFTVPVGTTGTGFVPYTVTMTNADGSVTCVGNSLEVIGL